MDLELYDIAPFVGIISLCWMLIALIAAIFPGNRKRRLLHAMVASFFVIVAFNVDGPSPEQALAREQKLAAEKALEVAETAATYEADLDIHLSALDGFDPQRFTTDAKSIVMAAQLLSGFAEVYARGQDLDLSAEGKKKHDLLRTSLSAKQKAALPVLRDAYGPAMRTLLWEADGKAKTFGSAYRTVEFINAAFAANRNIKEIHTEMYATLMLLRFTQARYKWLDADVEYQYYTLTPPGDGALVKWRANGSFDVIE